MKSSLLKTLFLFSIFILSNVSAGLTASPEYVRADKMFSQGNYEAALPLYKKALKAGPAGDVHARIGDCYFQLQDYSNALASFRSALQYQKRSQQPITQYWIGFSTFALGRDREAVKEFLKIPALYPKSGMWVSTAYYWAGRACERMGQKEKAEEYYRKAGGKGKSTQGRFALKKAEAVRKSSK